MSLYELLSIAVSALAAAIAILALNRSGATTKRQLELEERHAELADKQLAMIRKDEEDQSQARVDVELERYGSEGTFTISNCGAAPAFNVQCSIEPDDPIYQGELDEKFPIQELRPRKSIEIGATFTMGAPTKYIAGVSWSDPDGTEKSDRFELHS